MSTMSIERSTVEQAMRNAGYGHYAHYAADLTHHLGANGVNRESVQGFARQRRVNISDVVADAFVEHLTGSESIADPAGLSFDKATASEVIRAFLIGEDGYAEEAVDALLVLAGLEDEPEPEPETPEFGEGGTMVEALRAQVERLTEFARRHGYRG